MFNVSLEEHRLGLLIAIKVHSCTFTMLRAAASIIILPIPGSCHEEHLTCGIYLGYSAFDKIYLQIYKGSPIVPNRPTPLLLFLLSLNQLTYNV